MKGAVALPLDDALTVATGRHCYLPQRHCCPDPEQTEARVGGAVVDVAAAGVASAWP